MRIRLTRALSVALAAATLTAQETPRPGVSAAANLVRLDLHATQDGRPVDDLTREDVEVLEDGVRQSLDAFERVRLAPDGPHARVFVVFVDTYHTRVEGSPAQRQPLVRLLDRAIGPDDLVAVMTPEMAVSDLTFGRKAALIANLAQAEWPWARRGRTADDPKDLLYEACFAASAPAVAREMQDRRREMVTLDTLDALVTHLNGLREERKALVTVSEGWLLYRPSAQLGRPDRDDRESRRRDGGRQPDPTGVFRRGRARTDAQESVTGVSRTECDADRQAMATLDHSTRLRAIAEAANRATVSFYTVIPSSLAAATPEASRGDARVPARNDNAAGGSESASTQRTRQDALRFLADNTDGLTVAGTSQTDTAIARIANDLTSYYLLTYRSSNGKLDGRLRAITVRATRPGVVVRSRSGYRGPTADELLRGGRTSGRSGAPAPATALSSVSGAAARAPFRIRASAWTRPGDAAGASGRPGSFWVVGELDYATRRELVWTAGAKADVTVLAADGTEVTSATVAVPSSDGSFALQVPDTGGVAPGEYAVRVRVRPNGDETLAVSDSARVIVPAVPGALGEAVLWRRGSSTGPQFQRTADPRFRRSDRLRLELAAAAPGAATARLTDRNGAPLPVPVQVSERVDDTGGFRWVVAELALAPLAAGDYAVEVSQGGSTQATAFRMVP